MPADMPTFFLVILPYCNSCSIQGSASYAPQDNVEATGGHILRLATDFPHATGAMLLVASTTQLADEGIMRKLLPKDAGDKVLFKRVRSFHAVVCCR